MGDDGGYGDNSSWGGNYGTNNNSYADNYNYTNSYNNDATDYTDKLNGYSGLKNDDSRVYTKYEPPSKIEERSYELTSKIIDEPTKTHEDSRTNNEETRPEPNSIPPPLPLSTVPESHTKTESKEPEEKSSIIDHLVGGDGDDDDDELKFKKDAPNENITVTTAEINNPPGDHKSCDHKTIALFLGGVTAGELTSSEHEEAELQALVAMHDDCKCNGDTEKVAADGIDLDDTKETMDLLNDSSETRPVDDKPVEEDDCLLNVLSFCMTCCECVIS